MFWDLKNIPNFRYFNDSVVKSISLIIQHVFCDGTFIWCINFFEHLNYALKTCAKNEFYR